MRKRRLNPAITKIAKGLGFAVMFALLTIQLGHAVDAEFEVQQAEVQNFCNR